MPYHREHVLSNSLVFRQSMCSERTDLYKPKLDVLKYNNACLLIYYTGSHLQRVRLLRAPGYNEKIIFSEEMTSDWQ